MIRKSYVVLSCLMLPVAALAIANFASAGVSNEPLGVKSTVNTHYYNGQNQGWETYQSTDGNGNRLLLTDEEAENEVSPSDYNAYFGYDKFGNRISPNAGRRAKGLARAIIDVCKGSGTWNVCNTTDCGQECNGSSNPSCRDDLSAANYYDCSWACSEVAPDSTLCNGGNDGK